MEQTKIDEEIEKEEVSQELFETESELEQLRNEAEIESSLNALECALARLSEEASTLSSYAEDARGCVYYQHTCYIDDVEEFCHTLERMNEEMQDIFADAYDPTIGFK